MKRLQEYCLENLISIFEGAVGIKLNRSKNIELIINYLSKYFKDIKCIIPDSEEIISKYQDIKNWFTNDVNEYSLFYLKNNDNLCLYEPNVNNMSNDELNKYGISRNNETYHLDSIDLKIEATSKRINSSKSTIKIWPEKWNKYIVKGEHKIDNTAKMPTTIIDFKNQGAYVLNKISEIKNDLYESFVQNFGEDSPLSKLFKVKDVKDYLNNLNADDQEIIKTNMANILSEPLAIIALIDNIDMVQAKISEDKLGDLYEIIIPIKQNWPVADFYAHFKNLPDRLIAISVKSNGSGNSSTIIGCLPIIDITKPEISSKDKDTLLDFFNEIIPQYETTKNIELKISDELQDKLQNISLYALYLLIEESKTKNSNVVRLVNTFDNLIELIKNQDIYNELHKICELKGTNNIEKILISLFNINKNCISLIKNAVADATSCYKITVNNVGNVKCTKQSNNGSFRLIYKGGGQGLNLIVNDGKLKDVTLGHKTSQGQWLGYSFK